MQRKLNHCDIVGNIFLDNDYNKNNTYVQFPQKVIYSHNKLSQLLDSSCFSRYGFTIFISLIAIAVKYFFFPPFETPYLLALVAVMMSSLYAGFTAGLLSTIITVVFINYLFISPQHMFKINNNIFIQIVIYISQGLLVSFLIERERTSRKKISIQANQLQVTLDSIGDAVIVTNATGNIIFMNRVAEDITKWNYKEAIGENLESVFNIINEKTKKKALNPVKKVIAKNKVVSLENHTVLIRKNGSYVPIDDSAAPIKDFMGNLVGVVLVFRDITQRRQLEQRKDDFVSIVSHELKTPVTSIKLFIQVLRRTFQKNNDDKSHNILKKVDGELDKLVELINDFLDLSRIESGKLNYKKEIISLDDLTKETVKDLQQIYADYKILVKGRIGRKLPLDRDRIRQVLFNLITNAVKYSENNNKIIVKLGKNENQAIVTIQDFGIGIHKDQLSKIFDRFYQVNAEKGKTFPGLGLGLYISSEIIKGHNGKISVKSRIGNGSMFQFSLPFGKK